MEVRLIGGDQNKGADKATEENIEEDYYEIPPPDIENEARDTDYD